MMKICILAGGLLIAIQAPAQFTYKIKADTLLVTNDSCNAELVLKNFTREIDGFLYNKGNGRTEFRRALIRDNDSTYFIGGDTLIVHGSKSNAFIKNQLSAAQTADLWINGTAKVNYRMIVNTNDLGEPFSLQVGGNALFHEKVALTKLQIVDGFYKWATDYSTVTYGPSLTENAKLNITHGVSGGANILLQGTAGGGGGGVSPYLFFGDNNRAYAAVRGVLRGGAFTNEQYGDIAFYTSPDVSTTAITERMRILSNGNVLVNTTTDAGSYKFQVNGNSWTNGTTQYYAGASLLSNIKIGYDGVNPQVIHITGSDISGTAIKIDNLTYGGTGGVIDLTSNSAYNYSAFGDGVGAGLRFVKTAQNGGGLINYGGTYTDHRVNNNSNQEYLYGHYTKTRVGANNGYSYYADAEPLSGGAGTAYAFYANAGKSLLKDKLTVDGPNGYSQLQLAQTYTPSATNDSNGQVGDVAWDGSYIYIKTASGWKRASLSTF